MGVATVPDHAINSAVLGTFAVDRDGMKKDVTEKWENQTVMFVCPKLKVKQLKIGNNYI